MDIQRLSNLKHWLEYASFTFSLENYIILTNSLLLLQSENHFRRIFFWGIIQGLEADYYIAFGYEKDVLTERKYFYSEDYQNWKLLPAPEKEHLALTELCKRPFQGDPGLVVEVVDDAPPEDLFPDEHSTYIEETDAGSLTRKWEEEKEHAFEEEEEEKSKISGVLGSKGRASLAITSGELKEEDRLAAIIHIITEEAGVIPRGAIFKQTDGVSVISRVFEGIKLEDSDSLCSFQHYRIPLSDCNTNLLIRCDYNYAIDFLDTIDKDIPNDCWTAQLVEGDRTLILRSLHWPGYMFFHFLDSPDHGFIYVGQGQRNLDIPFMTQVMLPVFKPPEQEFSLIEITEERSMSTVGEQNKTSTKLSTKLGTKLGTRLETKLDSRMGSSLGTKLSQKRGSEEFNLEEPED